jgi:hypothetical protein
MEPEKFDKKKFDDLFKNLNFSFSTVPVFNYIPKRETTEEMIARLDDVDETVDAMSEYPQAKKMLDKLYGKL